MEQSTRENIRSEFGKELQTRIDDLKQKGMLSLKDKGVSYLKESLGMEMKKLQEIKNLPSQIKNIPSNIKNIPSEVKNLPSELKTNMAKPLKYVRKKITLRQLAFVGLQMLTGRVYYKLGMAMVWGLFNLAWKHYTRAGDGAQDARLARTQVTMTARSNKTKTLGPEFSCSRNKTRPFLKAIL